MGYLCLGEGANSARGGFKLMEQLVKTRLGKDYRKRSNDTGESTYWYPCFSQMDMPDPKTRGYVVCFNLSFVYTPQYVDSPEFADKIKYWVEVGKANGLRFDKLKWKILKSEEKDWYRVDTQCGYLGPIKEPADSRVLMFYFPLAGINSRKTLHAHLFFLRFLYEVYAVVDRHRALRSCREDYPWVSEFGWLLLAEKSCQLVQYQGRTPFAYGAHSFLNYKSYECVLLTAKGMDEKNLYEMMLENPNMSNFDAELGGPQIDYYNFKMDQHSNPTKEVFDSIMRNLSKMYYERKKIFA